VRGSVNMKVFISYVSEDAEQVQKISEYLGYYGVEVWIDKNNLEVGKFFGKDIHEAIKSVNFFIACFSKNYWKRNKTYMNEELLTAVEELRIRPLERSWFLPILLSDCKVPNIKITPTETLNDIHYIALYKDFESGIQKLIYTISPKFISKKITKLLLDLISEDENIHRIALKQMWDLPKITDKKIIKSLVEKYISEKTDKETVSYISYILRQNKNDVIPMIVKLITINYKNENVNKVTLKKLSEFCYPLSINEAIPNFINICDKNNISYEPHCINVPSFAWHLSIDSYIRVKDLFMKRNGTVWHSVWGSKSLNFDDEIQKIKLCSECNQKEAICIESESYADSGEYGYINRYECANCEYSWTEED